MVLKIFFGLVIFFSLWFAFRLFFSSVKNYEEPKYHVVFQQKPFEIRDYEDMMIATSKQDGQRELSIQKGFRKLFGYISGQNQLKKQITMTTPVIQSEANNQWHISFVLPRYLKKTDIPNPVDSSVEVQSILHGRYVVIRFSGRLSEKILNKQKDQLKAFINQRGCQIIQGPIYAFYNPPWTLPFLRRHEIWFQVAQDC